MITLSNYISERSGENQYVISEDSMEIIVHALNMLKKKGTIFIRIYTSSIPNIDNCLKELGQYR